MTTIMKQKNLPNLNVSWKMVIRSLLLLLFFSGMVLIPLESCSSGESKVKELISNAYKACEKEDYEKAHEYLNEIKALTANGDNGGTGQYGECRDKVIREECSFLIAQGDEQSAKRIAFLLAQNYGDSFDELDLMEVRASILELAKSVNNQYVIDVLEKKNDDDECE